MSEYVCGFEFIREPDGILPEGSVVETHQHNEHHNTHLTMGLWQVHRFVPIVGKDGVQTTDDNNDHLWHELPLLTVQGGGPRSIVPIPKNMKHKFVLIKGAGFYRCVFSHRDGEGNLKEVYQGYDRAYV